MFVALTISSKRSAGPVGVREMWCFELVFQVEVFCVERRKSGSLGVDGWMVEASAEREEGERREEEWRGGCGC